MSPNLTVKGQRFGGSWPPLIPIDQGDFDGVRFSPARGVLQASAGRYDSSAHGLAHAGRLRPIVGPAEAISCRSTVLPLPRRSRRLLRRPPPQSTADELQKATEYWGKQYGENPRDLKVALSYARNLKAMGEKRRALAVLQQASLFHGESRELASEYGRLALDLDQVSVAEKLLAVADDPTKPDWRVVSARGAALAKEGNYNEAIPLFERALSLAHNQPSVLSNLALAHAMNGEPEEGGIDAAPGRGIGQQLATHPPEPGARARVAGQI